MDVYVAAQHWTEHLVDLLAAEVDSVILGDLFCQRRMFDHGWFDVAGVANRARERGLGVVFQSPMYNTSRTMDRLLRLVRSLHESDLVDAVLIHDVGVLQALSRLEDLAVWWDRHGFNRDFVPSAYLVDFLVSHGVSRVEIVRPRNVESVAGRGCEVLLYAYGPSIATFGRICYTEYLLNEPCERGILCQRRSPSIDSNNEISLHYIADGYTLLDKKKPQHTLPVLTSRQIGRIVGATAYVRDETEVHVLKSIRQRLLPTRGAFTEK